MVATLALIAELVLPVAGHVRSATAEFRTTIWVSNLSAQQTTVRATFLERHPLKSAAPSTSIAVAPYATRQIDDLPLQLGREGVVGAIRFESDAPIDVSARIYSNGASGDGLRAVGSDDALAKGDEGTLTAVTHAANALRETTYFVETSGRPAEVFVRLRDASGREVAHDSFLLEAYEHRALPIAELAPNKFVQSGTISVRVPGGSGRVAAIGYQWLANDGYFVEMQIARARHGFLSAAEIAIYSLTALATIVAALYSLKNRRERLLS